MMSLIFSLHAQEPVRTLMYKVKSPQGGKTSYLFGTIHYSDPALVSWDKNVRRAFKKCHTVAGEISLVSLADQMRMIPLMLMVDSTLNDLISGEDSIKVWAAIKSTLDSSLWDLAAQMKPFFLMGAMAQSLGGTNMQNIPDMRFQTMAVEAGKPVVALEELKDHFAVADYLSYREQTVWLMDFIDNNEENSTQLDKTREYYLQGEIVRILESDESGLVDLEFEENLLHKRNRMMTDNLITLMEQNSVFCAVGAAHLIFETGLVAALRAKGYIVKAVPFRFLPVN